MSLIPSLAKVSGNTLISRLLGFVRDLIMAQLFGADGKTDAFLVAFKIPNFFRRLFAEGAFASAFVPVLMEYRVRRGFEELKALVDNLAGTLGVILLLLTLVGVIGAPIFILIFAPGFSGEEGRMALAVESLRLTFPYLLFISLTAFAGGILNVYNRFGIPAFTPVLLNLSIIGCAFWLAPRLAEPIVALAWGVLIAGVAQLTLQLPFLNRLGLLPRPKPAFRDPGVRRVLHLMLPALLGVSVVQVNLLLNTLLASFLPNGSISWLYYADRLMEFPLGLLGVALGAVILPNLAHRQAASSTEGFSRTLDWGLRLVLLLGVPSGIGLLVLAEPIMATLFQSAAFDAQDVTMAARGLMAYALGLVGFILIKVLAPAYYARQDTRTPVRIAVRVLLVNIILNIALMLPLAHAGLALATTLSASLNAWLLYAGLLRDGIYQPLPGWRTRLLRVLAACLLMALILGFGTSSAGDWLEMTRWDRVWRLMGVIGAGAGGYFLALWLLGIGRRDFVEDYPDFLV
ncbi:MAG: murein biosynthesis integral membrane protein MurJ [Gammaproteobacteria bacterium]|nr:murein biosynthesis integral membrane protein MurJ [Gammaproteobacteria bacterium]MBU1653970.1 murein biosynthesis integral membrane protein MurJ [Gammaproteobacteria bacterium]MBU1960478.1 murein biosynthesis integral membrane protein MurJ [Gammaproteobacteria bacterium]